MPSAGTAMENHKNRHLQAVSIVFYAVLFIFLTNILLGIVYHYKDTKTPVGPLSVSEIYTKEKLQEVYPGYSWEEIQKILFDTWNVSRADYYPHIEWKEMAATSTYFNVHEAGFRLVKNQAPWPPPNKKTVFIFGGSTTLGSGVPDWETIPSYVQELGRVNVYNFGQGGFSSIQERIYFEELLLDGIVPDVAVFIDGINEFSPGFGLATGEDSDMTRAMKGVWEQRSALEKLKYYYRNFYYEIPFVRLANSISLRLLGVNFIEMSKDKSMIINDELEDEYVEKTIERYKINQKITRAVSKQFGVKPLFILQPHPSYKYNSALFPSPPSSPHIKAYTLLDGFEEKDTLWLGGIQENREEPFYVDGIHYTAAFNREIAEIIVSRLND